MTPLPGKPEPQVGISIEDFWEREAGGAHSKAILLMDLANAVYGAREEWSYDESPEATELVRLLAPLHSYLEVLSIVQADGTLTRRRECGKCSGRGWYRGAHSPEEETCDECQGRGWVDPADD